MTDTLADAAALIRERAEAATWTEMPWGVDEIGAVWAQEADGQPVPISSRSTDENAEHIASWHPAVALAVADLIDWHAAHDVGGPSWRLAHAAAGAYLGIGGTS